MIAAGTLMEQKAPALKEICKALGVPVSGNKDALVGRIEEAVGKL